MEDKRKRIMIVDDDKEFLEELKETLMLCGYDSVAVNDSTVALDVAIREKPDLIILDLKMPQKSGFQLADELRRLEAFTQVPIIAMTGLFNSGYRKDDYRLLLNICGVKKFLGKPFNPLDIISQIEEELAEK